MITFNRGLGSTALGDFVRMQREMDRLHRQLSGEPRSRVYPAINIYDAEDGYHIRAELPGIEAETLDVTVSRNEVVIKGERPLQSRSEGERYPRRERESDSFSRAFAMPDHIDAENVKAVYRDGVLDLMLPRQAEAGPRKVAVLTD